jgi:hypothetical protein
MTCTVPERGSSDDGGEARKESRFWLYVSLAWGAIVALIAGLLDRSWLVAAGWLLSGLALGFAGPWLLRALGLFDDVAFRWYDDLWGGPDVFDFLDEVGLAADKELSQQQLDALAERDRNTGHGVYLLLAPAFGLLWGILLGPIGGALAALDPNWPLSATEGAIAGLVVGPVVVGLVASVACFFYLPEGAPKGSHVRRRRWLLLVSLPLVGAVAWLCVRVLVRLPKQRRICEEFERRGAVFGHGGRYVCCGISFRRMKLSTSDLPLLRVFPDLDSLDLSGTGIDDEGLAWLAPLKKLGWLNLSENPITDAGLTHLERLTRLRCVVLRATLISDEGVRLLQERLPSCTIER